MRTDRTSRHRSEGRFGTGVRPHLRMRCYLVLICLCINIIGCSRSNKYVPLATWDEAASVTSREANSPVGKFRCRVGFEYEGPVELQTAGGRYSTVIPQPCGRLVDRGQDVLAFTTTIADDTLEGVQSTVWAISRSGSDAPRILQLSRQQGVACNFRRRNEGIEFMLSTHDTRAKQCVLVTPDNRIYIATCPGTEDSICVR